MDDTIFNFGTSTGTTMSMWGAPEFKEFREVGESIEVIYTQTSNLSRTGGFPPYTDTRAVKIIYSCVDGKWNKSEPIYGRIIPPSGEYYEFEE